MGVAIREYRQGDAPALVSVFRRSVLGIAPAKYDDDQVAAWAARGPTVESVTGAMYNREAFVADDDGTIVGWIDLEPDGHIDRLYCAPEAAGRGVSDALYAMVLTRAKRLGLPQLYTEASLFGESFFRRHGWCLEEREVVTRDGVDVVRARMSLQLPREH